MNFFKIFCVFCLGLVPELFPIKKIYIIPPGGYEDEKLFDIQDTYYNRDNCVKHFYDLREALYLRGYELKTRRISDDLSDAECIFTSGIHGSVMTDFLKKYKDKKIIAFIWEPRTTESISYDKRYHDIFLKIFIMDDDLVDGNKYVKLFYPHPSVSMIDVEVPFNNKKLCTHISSYAVQIPSYPFELYSERRRAIRFFEQYPEQFTFYGKGWGGSQYCSAYGGPVERKLDILKNYKFSLCFENTSNMNGYISEKIFDSFEASCIPVYYGAPNIAQYIPKECFIDFREFKGYTELYKYLKEMKESEYAQRLQAIRNFLKSEQAVKFSFAYFIEQVLSQIF